MKISIHNLTEETLKKYIGPLKLIFDQEKNEKLMDVIFVEPKYIQKLNRDFRKIDKPTDVLSFPNDNEEDTSLGDVFINLKQAKKQASEYNHSEIREVCFLIVHGYLHLLGYSHDTEKEEKKMFDKQEEILNKAGIERK